ncbi:MAG: thermonuclease family protein [Pirellulales bacterium]|nr:thermonuclease family protein [Pirellulales bacterium]
MPSDDFKRAVTWGFGLAVGIAIGIVLVAVGVYGYRRVSLRWDPPAGRSQAPPPTPPPGEPTAETAADRPKGTADATGSPARTAAPEPDPVPAPIPIQDSGAAPGPTPSTDPDPHGNPASVPDRAGATPAAAGGAATFREHAIRWHPSPMPSGRAPESIPPIATTPRDAGGDLAGGSSSPLSPYREWRWREGLTGRGSVMARLMAVEDGTIRLRRANGIDVLVAIHLLETNDRKWLVENGFLAASGPAPLPGDPPASEQPSVARDESPALDWPPAPEEPPARSGANARSRPWTDTTGQHATTGSFLECRGGVVYLEQSEGKILGVPLAKLSQADRDSVESMTFPVQTMAGKVTGVLDGNTLIVMDASSKSHKIRLEGIECPTLSQALGAAARQSLLRGVFQKEVVVEWMEKDAEGRIRGDVIHEGRWGNKELVEEGLAWCRRNGTKSDVLIEAEKNARAARLGLWRDRAPAEP